MPPKPERARLDGQELGGLLVGEERGKDGAGSDVGRRAN